MSAADAADAAARVRRVIARQRLAAKTLGELAVLDGVQADLLRGDEGPLELEDPEKGWMGTSTGRKFWPLKPRAVDVDVRDVARGLAMTCRYGGQVKRYYSVAEHCVLVARHAPAAWKREALFHDCAEAYIGDMIRPLKHQPEMREFRRAENEIEAAVFERLGLAWTAESHAAVKLIDDRILVNEINALSARPDFYLETPLLRDKAPLALTIECWEPTRAEAEFLRCYVNLFGADIAGLP